MAEGGSCPSLDTDEDLLYCSVCMEEFEDPRALPCLHTFCYKCLVQLSKGKDTMPVDLSDINLQPLKSELASCDSNSSQPQSDRNVLKCPLCAEEHVIPEDKGVNGFRKDFRINTLVEQHKMKSIGLISKTFEESKVMKESISNEEDAKKILEKCLHHPDENLLYHCENKTCQYDICDECWGSKHDDHVVKLLSMKVNGAKEALLQEMENNIFQVASQVDVLSATQESTSEQDAEILQEIKQKYLEMQKQLEEAYQQASEQFNIYKKVQERKISEELHSLIALQDTFKQIRNGIDKENLPPTSKAFKKYEGMQDKMHELTKSLTNWSFTYTKAELPAHDPSKEIQVPVSVAYEETSLDQMVEDGEDYDEEYAEEYNDEEDYENEDFEGDEYGDEYDEGGEYSKDYENEDYAQEGYDEEYDEDDAKNEYPEDENSEDGATSILNICSLHPGQKLIYHCGTCKTDVCQECWSCSHDSHVVKLRSMKFECDNVPPQQATNQNLGIVHPSSEVPLQSTEERSRAQSFQTTLPVSPPLMQQNYMMPPGYGQPFLQPRPNVISFHQPVSSAPMSPICSNQFVRYTRPPPIRIRFLQRPAGRGQSRGRGTVTVVHPKQNTSRGAPRGGRRPRSRGGSQPRGGGKGSHSQSDRTPTSSNQKSTGGPSRGGRGQRSRGRGTRGGARGGHTSSNLKPKSPAPPKPSSAGQGQKARGGTSARGSGRGGHTPNKSSKPNSPNPKPPQDASRGGGGRGSRGGGGRGRGQRGSRGSGKK